MIEYESKKLDVAFIKDLFSKRLEYLSNSIENKRISSNEIMSILTKDNLIKDWVVEVESWDNAWWLFYKFNINPEKAFVDWNTNLHEWDIEFLTAEATLVVKLKELEKSWVIRFWKDNIPILNENIWLIDELKVLWIMKEFIWLQLKKELSTEERKNFEIAQKNLDSIKLEYPKWIWTQEINSFTNWLNFNDLPEVKNWTINKEQRDFLSEVNDWFEKRSEEEKILIVWLIMTVWIVWLVYTAPLIIPILEWVALRWFLSFISMVERSRIASFLVWLSPSSWQITNNLNLSNSSRIFLNLWNISKEILKNTFPMMQKFMWENQWKKWVA